MSKIKMTRQEWETIIHTGQEMITSHVDYLINGEGLNADGVLSELESTRIYYEAENIETVEERSDKETPRKPNYTYEDYQNAFEYFVAGRVFTKEMFEMGAIWKDLLDRRKPTKPNYINDNKFCSKCDFKVTVMGLWDMNYCSNCGQKIYWSNQHE